jgi:hypothetical protein
LVRQLMRSLLLPFTSVHVPLRVVLSRMDALSVREA